MSASGVLVTGGTGTLGRRVVERLEVAGSRPGVLSRGGTAGTVKGDLLTGEGLDAAVRGVNTIVHCASSPVRDSRRVDVEGTRLLLRAAEEARVAHVVFISIVGVDRDPYYPYYRVKLEAEGVVERSRVPWTILRATQFHEFVLRLVRPLCRLPLVPVPKGLPLQPVDVGEVAGRLAELALSGPAGRVPDVGGPEVRSFADLTRAYLGAAGTRKRVVELPVPGRMARAWREGAHLCPDERYGSISWEEFLGGPPVGAGGVGGR